MTSTKEMTHEDFNTLTRLIDTYNYENEELITPNGLCSTWWPLLNQLRQAPNKDTLLAEWKYKKELENVEFSHIHGENSYINVADWAERFVVALWLYIYH